MRSRILLGLVAIVVIILSFGLRTFEGREPCGAVFIEASSFRLDGATSRSTGPGFVRYGCMREARRLLSWVAVASAALAVWVLVAAMWPRLTVVAVLGFLAAALLMSVPFEREGKPCGSPRTRGFGGTVLYGEGFVLREICQGEARHRLLVVSGVSTALAGVVALVSLATPRRGRSGSREAVLVEP